jgi:hypothetical protein
MISENSVETKNLSLGQVPLYEETLIDRGVRKTARNEVDFMNFSNFDRAWQTAEMISKAKCVPQQFWGNPADILVVIQFGHELDLPPMFSLQNIMIVNNRPTLYGDAMLAVCIRSRFFIDCIETYDEENETAYCTVERKGRNPITRKFSRAMAQTAKLWGKVGPWSTNPERMLQLRARAFALRDMFPDVLRGLLTFEEMTDVTMLHIKEPKNVSMESTVNAMKERLKEKKQLCVDADELLKSGVL